MQAHDQFGGSDDNDDDDDDDDKAPVWGLLSGNGAVVAWPIFSNPTSANHYIIMMGMMGLGVCMPS